MVTKTISLTEEAYGRLAALKSSTESFSEEVMRLTGTSGSILDLAGSWSDLSEKDAEKMKKYILTRRKDRSRLDEIYQRLR